MIGPITYRNVVVSARRIWMAERELQEYYGRSKSETTHAPVVDEFAIWRCVRTVLSGIFGVRAVRCGIACERCGLVFSE
jgi:hypothetical protein